MRRAQTSVEFLILFSVVLILTLLIVSSLGLFPSLGQTFTERNAKQYWQTEDIALLSYGLNASHAVFRVQNNLDDTIRIDSIFLDSVLKNSPSLELSPGELETISFTHGFTVSSNDVYDYDVRFLYTNLEDFQEYSLYGMAPIIGGVS